MHLRQFSRFVAFSLLLSLLLSGCHKQRPPSGQATYLDPEAPVEKRVEDLLSRLTLRDKIDLLSYNKDHRPGLDQLGMPLLDLNDGPLGIGGHPATCFPAGVSFAATWNPELIRQVGRAIGEEARAYGIDVVLGPCVGIQCVDDYYVAENPALPEPANFSFSEGEILAIFSFQEGEFR